MDGTQAAQEILRGHSIPVIFLSAHTEREVVEKTEKITSFGYVVKNTGSVVLSASIKMAFKLQAAYRALSHSHNLMRYVIEHSRSAIAIHDRSLNYVYVSKQYLLDYKISEDNVIGRHHYEVFPDLPQKWRDVHQRVLAGEVLSAEDDPYVRADGSVDWTRWECRPWYEADGSIGGIIVYTEVITRQKQVEEALKQSLQEKEALLQELQSLLKQST